MPPRTTVARLAFGIGVHFLGDVLELLPVFRSVPVEVDLVFLAVVVGNDIDGCSSRKRLIATADTHGVVSLCHWPASFLDEDGLLGAGLRCLPDGIFLVGRHHVRHRR